MLNVVKYEDLGRNTFSWLDARHHFSFGHYYNPKRMGFANLRVINDDIVQAGTGFDTHPHKDMEIITYVRKGAITHRDSLGNEGRTEAGDVQVMSAGTGVYHSEYNLESEDTNLYQIWILPNKNGVAPRWDARVFPKDAGQTDLSLLVSGDKADEKGGALFIHADAKIYGGRFIKGHTLNHTLTGPAYLLVSEGSVTVDGQSLKRGDGLQIDGKPSLSVKVDDDAEILLIQLTA